MLLIHPAVHLEGAVFVLRPDKSLADLEKVAGFISETDHVLGKEDFPGLAGIVEIAGPDVLELAADPGVGDDFADAAGDDIKLQAQARMHAFGCGFQLAENPGHPVMEPHPAAESSQALFCYPLACRPVLRGFDQAVKISRNRVPALLQQQVHSIVPESFRFLAPVF